MAKIKKSNTLISGIIIEFFLNEMDKIDINHNLKGVNKFDREKWYKKEVLNKIIAEIESVKKIYIKTVGLKFYEAFKDMFDEYGNTYKEVFLALPKIYSRFHKGNVGTIIINEIGSGHTKISQNTIYPCLFFEGLLKGIANGIKLPANMIKHPLCMLDGNNYCVYEVVWAHCIRDTNNS